MESYNLREKQALQTLNPDPSHLLIEEEGRDAGEAAVVWIENGVYRGYGFVPRDHTFQSPEDLQAFIIPQRAYPETDRILQSYLIKNPERTTVIEYP